MRKFLFFLLTLIFLSACPVRVSAGGEKYARSVVQLLAIGTDGKVAGGATGVAISNNEILTAGHFCFSFKVGVGAKKLKDEVFFATINANDEEVIYDGANVTTIDLERDLCLIEREKHGIVPITFAPSSPKRYARVYIVGGPRMYFPIITEGFVSSVERYIITSAAATFGNSGGALVDWRGRLLGIVIAVDKEYHHVSMSVPIEQVRAFLKK
jgi:S1-C subfamily serine protease